MIRGSKCTMIVSAIHAAALTIAPQSVWCMGWRPRKSLAVLARLSSSRSSQCCITTPLCGGTTAPHNTGLDGPVRPYR